MPRLSRKLAAVLLLANLVPAPGFAQPSTSSLGAAPDTLTVRHFAAPPAPDPLPSPRWGSAAAVFRGKLYLFGGSNGNRWIDEVLSFDPSTGHWTALAPMPVSSLGISAAVTGNKIIIGDTGPPSEHTFLYDPESNSWSRGPSFVHARGSINLNSIGKGAFAMGGIGGDAVGVSTFETLSAGRWQEAGAMPFLRGNMATATLHGKIYFAGGYNAGPGSRQERLANLDEYDPGARQWRSLAPMSTARMAASAAVLGDRLYIAGGENRLLAPSLATVEVYDIATNAWTAAPPMPQPRRNAAAAALDGRLYLIGGSPRGNSASATIQVYDPERRSWMTSGDAAPSAPPARFERRSPERPHDYALVIGIANYKGLPPADFAESDARDMALAFEALGVPEENVVSLIGAKAGLSEVSKYVEEWLPRRVSKDSRVFVYFSGHGSPDVSDGSAYLMPWDADASFVKSTGFPLARLYKALGALPARHVIALIDSCFSGAGGRSVLVAGARPLVTVRLPTSLPPGISVLTASESEEIAGSLPERGHGLFSYYALQGISGAADPDGKGHVTLEDLYAYVHKHVILDARRQNREQTPTLASPTPKLRLY